MQSNLSLIYLINIVKKFRLATVYVPSGHATLRQSCLNVDATITMLGKSFSRRYLKCFPYFFQKIDFGVSSIANLLSAESAQRMVKTSHYENAYSNILKISPPKNWKFSDKNSDMFHISAQNIDCGYLGEAVLTSTHNLCFWAKIKSNVYPCKPQFFFCFVFFGIKVGFRGSKLCRYVFVMKGD